MSRRPTFSKKDRAEVFRDNAGRCHLCALRIGYGEDWHIEHVTARELGGSDDRSNLKPAHVDCHAGKTRKDRKLIARNDRALIANTPGLKPSSRAWSRGRPRVKYLEAE